MTILPGDHSRPLVSLRDAAAAPAAMRSRRVGPAPETRAASSRVVVFDSLDAAAAAWGRLEAVAPASPYQTLAWVAAWMETEGSASGVRPVIGVALDEHGLAVALLPLGRSRRGLLHVVGFLGGRHANYNLGLFDPAIAWSAADVERLLRAIAASGTGRLDVMILVNQPLTWNGWRNPLALLPHQVSPSQGHRAELEPDGEAFLRRHQSAASRKKLRSKAAQLAALGPVDHIVARSPAMVDRVLDAYVAQKSAKLAVVGATSGEAGLAGTRRLYARASRDGEAAALELHALFCGARIVATFGGLRHAGRFSGLLISHDADPAFARLSPGEILLTAVVRAQCEAGVSSFDLGIGEARYKAGFCPIDDPLVDSLVPMSPLGHLFVAYEAFRLSLKRRIKQSAWAWPLALAIRRRLAARRLR